MGGPTPPSSKPGCIDTSTAMTISILKRLPIPCLIASLLHHVSAADMSCTIWCIPHSHTTKTSLSSIVMRNMSAAPLVAHYPAAAKRRPAFIKTSSAAADFAFAAAMPDPPTAIDASFMRVQTGMNLAMNA